MNNNFNESFSLALQILSYMMLLGDANNNDLLRYLQHQDNDLLNKIIEQNEQIIELLRGGNGNAKNKHKKSNSENS